MLKMEFQVQDITLTPQIDKTSLLMAMLMAMFFVLFMHFAITPPALWAATTDTQGWFPLALPWDDSSRTAIDASDLLIGDSEGNLAEVIDARGFVVTDENGHFIFSNTGQRARFWGTNLTFSANFPPNPKYPCDPAYKDEELCDSDASVKLAARLSKLGFNAVRLMSMDYFNRPRGLWLNNTVDTQKFDPVQLDRLDYLVWQLKRHGIYVDLTLHVGRDFIRNDGVSYAEKFQQTDISHNKGATLFDPVMIGLQKKYAKDLLNHVNPYTGLAYKDDPVILATETTNEDTLFSLFVNDHLNYDPADPSHIPEFYSKELDGWATKPNPNINRLYNPGFESALSSSNWVVWSDEENKSKFTFSRVSEAYEGNWALMVDILEKPSLYYRIAFFQNRLALQAGKRYILSFMVKGSKNTTIGGQFLELPNYNSLGWSEPTIDVTTEWSRRSYEFVATGASFGQVQLSFYIGQEVRSLWFDDFVFQEADTFPGWHGWLNSRYGDPEGDLAEATEAIRQQWEIKNPVSEDPIPGYWYPMKEGATEVSFDPTSPSDGKYYIIEVRKVDGIDSHVRLSQLQREINTGQAYCLSFEAKTDMPGEIRLVAKQAHDPWNPLGNSKNIDLDTEWKRFEYRFIGLNDDTNGMVQIYVGQSVRTLWFQNLSFRRCNPQGLLPGESLEDGTIVRIKRSDFEAYSPGRIYDTLRFYEDTQEGFFDSFRDFLQNEAGTQSLNTGSISCNKGLNDVYSLRNSDFIDSHLYWDHPTWSGQPWTTYGWTIKNNAWVNSPFSKLFDQAVMAVKGKPFTVTEFDQPYPNRYGAEAPILLATIANLQDWDAVFVFDFSGDQMNFPANKINANNYFDLVGNPLKTGIMPVASRIFLGYQTDPAPEVSPLSFTQEERLDSAFYNWNGSEADFLRWRKGVKDASVFGSRLRIEDFDAESPVDLSLPAPVGPVYKSAGNQLVWDASIPGKGLYSVNSLLTQGGAGFLTGRTVTLSNISINAPSQDTQFAVVMLQSRDGLPIDQSRRMILSIFTRVENTGMEWNSSFTYIPADKWGTAPTLIEPLTVNFTLLNLLSPEEIEITALDETGAFKKVIPFTLTESGQVIFSIDTGNDHTLWYAVERTCGEPGDTDDDDDGIFDDDEDINHNGVTDVGETDVCDPDTDNDGFNDGLERDHGTDPLDNKSYPEFCRSDFDGDGDVDVFDLGIFAMDFGRTDCAVVPTCEGDFLMDGDVDVFDLGIFASEFGKTQCTRRPQPPNGFHPDD